MASSAAVVRYVATSSATPTESSSVTVARYVVTASATPTARGFLEAAMKTLRSLAPLGAATDLHFSPVAARPGGGGDDYNTSGYQVSIRPRALSYQIATRPRAFSFPVAARPGGGGDDYHTSGYQVSIRPRALSFPLAALPDGDGDDDDRDGSLSAVATRTRSPSSTVATGTRFIYFMVATRPRAPTFFPAAIRSAYGSASCCNRSLVFPSKMVPGPLFYSPKRLAQLPSVYTSGRRHASNWAWTPWEPQRPKHSPTSPQELDGILKRLSEIELSHEEEVKFKTAFFKRFYSENIEDPKTVDMKLDLIMHKLDDLREEILQSRRKKKSEWGTFMIFGRKIDLSKVVAFLGFWF